MRSLIVLDINNMSFSRRLALLTLLPALLVSTVSLAAPAPPPPARKSADGLDLPAATEHKFHVAVPLASTLLGFKPEEVGRVFNVKQSAAILAKKTTDDLESDWFVLNHDGADVVGLSLTYGRVSKAVMYLQVATNDRIAALHKQLDSHDDKTIHVTFKTIPGDGKKQSLMLTFEADPIEFYIATHVPEKKIADGLRSRTYVDGMTDAEAAMVGDGPGHYMAIYAGDPKKGGNNDD